jgi:hypothetical protein
VLAAGEAVPAFYDDRKFMTWLAKQKPWSELVYRIALKDEIRDPAAAIDWNLRITTLERRLIQDEADVAQMLTDVDRAKGEITKIIDVK